MQKIKYCVNIIMSITEGMISVKKAILQYVLSAAGGCFIGLFANRLDTGMGAALFALGICMLTASLVITSGGKKGDD